MREFVLMYGVMRISWELGEKYGPIQYYLKQRKSKEEEKKIKELLEYLNKDANK